ncbi:MAG: hypothetical protein A3H98_09580 [Bacteroidetes bacterium RIFCSPLOWO2_02_FULL_36_8]|nr:MAG: hypothetical protein A3H98_09580 [Bacteroidetes bacterium RIFCSPLOWO2_02_FULL_36_8]
MPTQNCIIAGQRNGGLHIIDLNTNKETHFIQAFANSIFDIILGEKVGTFYVASGDGSVSLWHIDSLHSIKIQKATSQSSRTLAYNSNSHELAVGYSDHKIRIFDSDELKPKITLSGHKNSIFSLSYTPDNKYLLSGGRDAQIKIWEVASDYKEVTSIAAHTFAINHISFRPDGKYFATASMDKNVKIWKTEDFQLVKVINQTKLDFHTSSVNKLLWTSDNLHLITCGDDRLIFILAVLEVQDSL